MQEIALRRGSSPTSTSGRWPGRAWTLMVAVALAVAALAGCSASPSSADQAVRLVGPAEFADSVTQEGTVVIDVRTPAEFAQGHLPGAVNIDVQGPDFARRVAELDRAGTYAVYCQSGRRSGVATSQMADLGFGTVYDLEGGVLAWQAADGPLVSGP